MRYYKLIKDNTIIGVVTSSDFMCYSPYTDCFLRADEQVGEYVTCQGKFYRSSWMQPPQVIIEFEEVVISVITEEEYEVFRQALINNEVIRVEEEAINPVYPVPADTNEEITLEFIRTSKINEMSYICRQTIEAGFDLEIRGEVHHFSLDTQDQLNLISLSSMAQTQSLIPYHADGEECIFYTSEEIGEIVATATSFKIYHTTYYNALKGYINALDSVEAIGAITYGTEIPEEYKSDVLKALEQ